MINRQKDKTPEISPYYLQEKTPNSIVTLQSSRQTDAALMKAEYISLESARLQRHKINSINTLNSAAKLINALNDIKNKETPSYPTYLLTTQEDVSSKDFSADPKAKFKKSQTIETTTKYVLPKKKDENTKKTNPEDEAFHLKTPSKVVKGIFFLILILFINPSTLGKTQSFKLKNKM